MSPITKGGHKVFRDFKNTALAYLPLKLGALFPKNALEPSFKSLVFKSHFLFPSGFIFKK
jgi:hypothetical protein